MCCHCLSVSALAITLDASCLGRSSFLFEKRVKKGDVLLSGFSVAIVEEGSNFLSLFGLGGRSLMRGGESLK